MRGTIVAAASLLVVGCGHAAAPAPKEPAAACKPPKVVLTLAATDKVNPAPDGRGRPVQVRVYLLKSDARLQTAKFEDIWQNQAAALGEDLLKTEEITLFPRDSKSVAVAQNADAHNLAVVALFREPQGKHWFVSYEMDQPRSGGPCPAERPIRVTLDRMQLEDGPSGGESPDSKGN